MCAVKFLRLEEMLDNPNQGQLSLEPQGLLHAKVHAITRLIAKVLNKERD